MISCEVDNFCALCQQPCYVFDDLHVRLGPVAFAELPHIDNVAIKNDRLGFDRFKVPEEFFCVATVRAEMDIGKNNEVEFSFSSFRQYSVLRNKVNKPGQ